MPKHVPSRFSCFLVSAASYVCLQFAGVHFANARDLGPVQPLEGVVGNLYFGDWIAMNGSPTEQNIAANETRCAEPLIHPNVAKMQWPGDLAQSVPGLLEAKGSISIFKSGDTLALAISASEIERSQIARVYAIAHPSYRQKKPFVVVSYLLSDQYRYDTGWNQLEAGKWVSQGMPYSTIVETGMAKAEHDLMQAGKNEAGRDIALLYRPVTAKGEIIEGKTRQYFRCGDVDSLMR